MQNAQTGSPLQLPVNNDQLRNFVKIMSPAAQDLRNRANRADRMASSEKLKWQIFMQEGRGYGIGERVMYFMHIDKELGLWAI